MTASPTVPNAVPSGPDATSPSLRAVSFAAALSVLVLACWFFPRVWYTRQASDQPSIWLGEVTNAPGWSFTPGSVDKSAEAQLAADAIFYGEFARGASDTVRLFTARRYQENPNEIGLFVHTPDRCWTEAGWRIEPDEAETAAFAVGGLPFTAERRVFVHPAAGRELVYFFGLVGGQTLPYRLDHNLGVGRRFRRAELAEKTGGALRARDDLFWQRLWDSFQARRRLFGSKELVRISTPVLGGDLTRADALLKEALATLLVPQDARSATAPSPPPR